MSRQITDLSAAGANLFHAVVELQRLRASSERKFQRWFFETRQNQERAQEMQAQLEHNLVIERRAREETLQQVTQAEQDKKNAERMVAEMRRELQISKEEARRAWEELGRREQEERERTMSLREGQPTVVGGVQVVPMQGMGRPPTRDRPGTAGSSTIEQAYTYEEGESPTGTDPFLTREGGQGQPLHHEPDVSSMGRTTYANYPAIPQSTTGTIPVTSASSTRRTAAVSSDPSMPAPLQPHGRAGGSVPVSRPPGEQFGSQSTTTGQFYQQREGTYLHGSSQQQQQQQQQRVPGSRVPQRDETYAQSIEDSEPDDEEYELDGQGRRILDADGRPIPYRPRQSEESDDYDVREELERERQLAQQYGVSAPPSSGVSAGGPGAPAYSQAPDYTGQGYGEWSQTYRHPTRLSDVLEEDERSRTSPSHASQTSRGMY